MRNTTILLGLAVAACMNCPAASAAKQRPTVMLKVIDDLGRGVEGAKLWINQDRPNFPYCPPEGCPPSVVVRTVFSGLATAQLPAAGKSIVAVTADGHAPLFVRGVDLTSPQPYVFRLGRGKRVTGSVVGPDGSPVAGVRVQGKRDDPVLRFDSSFGFDVTTDASGRFEAAHLGDGKYAVQADLPEGDADGTYIDTSELRLLAGGPVTTTLELHAQPGAILSGRVVSPDGIPVGGREVHAFVRLPKRSQHQNKTRPDGSFVVSGIPMRSAGVIAVDTDSGTTARVRFPPATPFLKSQLGQIQFANVPAGLHDGVVVTMRKNATVTGRVTDTAGKPVEGVRLTVNTTHYVYTSDKDGRYTARVPVGEEVRLEVSAWRRIEALQPEPFAVERPGDSVVKDFTVTLLPQLPHDRFITGKVIGEDGKPAGGATVYLSNQTVTAEEVERPSDGRSTAKKPTWKGTTFWAPNTKAGADGRFTFNLLDPGKTDVWAAGPDRAIGWVRDVSSVTKSEKAASVLTITLRKQPEIASISGAITDRAGKPVEAAAVVVFNGDHNRPEQLALAQSDAAGQYTLSAKLGVGRGMDHLRLLVVPKRGAVAWRLLPPASADDINVRLEPEARAAGRVVTEDGKPVAGARVGPYSLDHPAYGKLFFWHKLMRDLPPGDTTDEGGAYDFGGIPAGAKVSLQAKHPDFDGGHVWHVNNVRDTHKMDDIELKAGVVFGGTVTYPDGRPAAGARVKLGWFDPDRVVTTDEHGRYRFAGLDNGIFSDAYTGVHATLGGTDAQSPEWEGTLRFEGNLYSGDRIDDADIVLERSFASRHAEWRQQRGTPRAGTHLLAVLHDADKAYSGKSRYDDTLSIIDSDGKVRASIGGVNVGGASGDFRPMMAHPDGSLSLAENTGKRLMKFAVKHLAILREERDVAPYGLAVDPKTGNLWVLRAAGESRQVLRVIDSSGATLRESPAEANHVVYSPRDDAFWLVGHRMVKLGRDGKTLAESQERIGFIAASVAVNERDGSLWVCEREHPQMPGTQRRVIVVGPDGQLRREWPDMDAHLAVDAARGVVWVRNERGLSKMRETGEVVLTVPVPCMTPVVEPDTGYVWVAGPEAVWRLDDQGRAVAEHPTPGGSSKWIGLMPQ